MGKKNPPETPFWGHHVKKRVSEKLFAATCHGCLDRISQRHWQTHPLQCPNVRSYKKIIEFQRQ